MKRVLDPEWRELEVKILAWDERIRTREREIQQLDERLRDLEQRMGVLRRRLALGTGVMPSVADPADEP
jgi:chromosome segregation ATPase